MNRLEKRVEELRHGNLQAYPTNSWKHALWCLMDEYYIEELYTKSGVFGQDEINEFCEQYAHDNEQGSRSDFFLNLAKGEGCFDQGEYNEAIEHICHLVIKEEIANFEDYEYNKYEENAN